MLNFQAEGHVYAIYWYNIFTNYIKWILFQLLYRDIRIHIPVLTGFKMDASVAKNVVIFDRKKSVLKLDWQGEGRLSGNSLVNLMFW